MFKKTLLLAFMAAAIFANPLVNSASTSFIIPIPPCYPCKLVDLTSTPGIVASEPKEAIIPIPPCYPCKLADYPNQAA